MNEQKIIDILTDHNKLVRVNNKDEKVDYDYFVSITSSFYSGHLQPLFDSERKDRDLLII